MNARVLPGARAGRSWAPRRAALLGVGVLLVLVAMAAAVWRFGPWAGPGFVEHAMPAGLSIPTALTAAPDGSIWFTVEGATVHGVFRDGRIETVPKGVANLEPLGLAVDRAGNVWFTDSQIKAVSRLAPDGSLTSFPLASPASKLGRLAVGPDGAVWLAEGDLNSLVRIKDGQLTLHELPTPNARPFGVAVAPDGTVWATLSRANKLARLSPDGQVREIDIPTRASEPTDVAIDAGGAVWFSQTRGHKIGRYADGRFGEYPILTAQGGPTGLAVAPDGTVWFAATRAQKIGRLRDGTVTELALPRADARPLGVAVDGIGNVWYTDIKGKLGMLPADRAR